MTIGPSQSHCRAEPTVRGGKVCGHEIVVVKVGPVVVPHRSHTYCVEIVTIIFAYTLEGKMGIFGHKTIHGRACRYDGIDIRIRPVQIVMGWIPPRVRILNALCNQVEGSD